MRDRDSETAAGARSRRLFYYTGGFLRQPALRRILQLSGWHPLPGLHATGLPLAPAPGPQDHVAVWGHSPYARRGEAVAEARGAGMVRLEDAFLRSVLPGRMRHSGPPLGLMIDETGGMHYDSRSPSALERILKHDPLDDAHLLQRAKLGMARMAQLHLSKYNNFDPEAEPPPPGYVLIVDQTLGDASIALGGARESTFLDMLFIAQEEHPGARIVIRCHPETRAGARSGHFAAGLAGGRISLCTTQVSPRALLEGAIAVYTVSSQMGFDAILAGHRPRVFGQPFYAGWGLTQDEHPVARRHRALTPAQLFAAAMILAPTWYDPLRDRLCSFEEALDQLEADLRGWREDRLGHVASGMRLWKRGHLQKAFGRYHPVIFDNRPDRAAERARSEGRGLLVWGSGTKTSPETSPEPAAGGPVLRHVEDGMLRSRGLGAKLVPPLSLVTDAIGIYYDPSRPSMLENLIMTPLPPGGAERALRLRQAILAAGLSKYTTGTAPPDLPARQPGQIRILVPGQVEDDASIRLGCSEWRSNLDLLRETRARNPQAQILYKPHPDVLAGLRPGAIAAGDLQELADIVLGDHSPAALLAEVDAVWTLTSTLGFEALLRDLPVTCLGMPFYAGWGLTTDLAPQPLRRAPRDGRRPDLAQLIHAVLIAYPRYFDPETGRPCSPEAAVARLASDAETGAETGTGLPLRLLSKAQGLLASQAWLWRR